MANLAAVRLAFLWMPTAIAVQSFGGRDVLASSTASGASGAMNRTDQTSSCQYIEVSAYATGYIQLPSVSNIRAISMWFAPYKDGGYAWEYLFDARSGLGSGWFSFLNSLSSMSIGSNWQTIYVNGVASSTSV